MELNNIRILKLLKKLNNPHDYLPKVIHVAGTNGKGSTIAFIKAGLESRGDRVHVFTSPHLIDFRERISISGKKINKGYFNSLLNKCIEANGGNDLSFFELLTSVAFLAFSENKADWTILEVGLGGRLDSTNVIKNPYLSIITPISLDHKEFLGNSIEKIAAEKGGIIKKNSDLILSSQNKSCLRVLNKIASNQNSKTITYGNDFKVKFYKKSFLFYTKKNKIMLPLPNLSGKHQIENAAVSIAVLKKLKCRKKNLIDALKNVSWPGRLQRIDKGRLGPQNLGINGEIFLDGGHNIAAGIALSNWIKNSEKAKLYVILAMMKNKDLNGFLQPFKKNIHKLIAIKINENNYDPKYIVQESIKKKIDSYTADSLENALKTISIEKSSIAKRVLVTGSLYLIGHFLEKNK